MKDHVYVGLGSFAMEDHKMINAYFGIDKMISLEIDSDVLRRQKFNNPLGCIRPTHYSTDDYISNKSLVFREAKVNADKKAIVWFDMTDSQTLSASLSTFQRLLELSQPEDIVRMTVDIDEKTFGRRSEDEALDDLRARRYGVLREQLGDDLKPGAHRGMLSNRLGIARLVTYAFRLNAEKAFEHSGQYCFLPLSLTTYADGHRMLSITGAVVGRDAAEHCLSKTDPSSIPGGVKDWENVIDIRIPQLTVWEKLAIDRVENGRDKILNFRLHDTISTNELLAGYRTFQRFYPTFRHVSL